MQKELQALHKPGSFCVTRFLLGALGVDFTQIRREKYQGVRKVGGRGKSWIMLGKIEKLQKSESHITLMWMRCTLSFALIRSAVTIIRGRCSSTNCDSVVNIELDYRESRLGAFKILIFGFKKSFIYY